MSQTTFDQRRPNELRPHPMNEEVYGDRADADLIESVRTKGVLNPLLITADNLIVSGHRRWGAAIAAGLTAIPVVITPITDPLTIEEALIESNRQRQKTNEQIGREYKRLKHIYNERQSRQGQRTDLTSSSREDEVRPTARAAAELGVSQPTAHRIETVVDHINDLKANGETGKAEDLRQTLNRSANAAYNTVNLDREISRLGDWLIQRGWCILYAPMPDTCYVSKNSVKYAFANRNDKVGELAALRNAKTHEEENTQSTKPHQSEVVTVAAPRHLTPSEVEAVIWRAIQHAGHTTPAAQLDWLILATAEEFHKLLNPGVTVDPELLTHRHRMILAELKRQIDTVTPPSHNSHNSYLSHPPATDPVEVAPAAAAAPSTEVPSRPHVTNNSGNNEWYTPAPIANAARSVLGAIDLDPASCAVANEVIKAEKFYGIVLDGLTQSWAGRIWLNPPYASDQIGRFVEKLTYHLNSEDITEAIVLVNNATETAWFQDLAAYASAVCFPKGRIKYWNPDRPDALSPLQGQAILYIGPNNYKFRSVFSDFGVVL